MKRDRSCVNVENIAKTSRDKLHTTEALIKRYFEGDKKPFTAFGQNDVVDKLPLESPW